jgi:hypothetical protein
MIAISEDGYVYSYTPEIIHGQINIYDSNGNYVTTGGVTMILAYEEDGHTYFNGGPLRIAFINDDEPFTDSYLWTKYVKEIEFFDSSHDKNPPSIQIKKPENALYLFDKKIIPFSSSFIIGDITIKAQVIDDTDVANVLFIMKSDDNVIQIKNLRNSPYEWNWNKKSMGKYTISILSYDSSGNIDSIDKEIFILNPF